MFFDSSSGTIASLGTGVATHKAGAPARRALSVGVARTSVGDIRTSRTSPCAMCRFSVLYGISTVSFLLQPAAPSATNRRRRRRRVQYISETEGGNHLLV